MHVRSHRLPLALMALLISSLGGRKYALGTVNHTAAFPFQDCEVEIATLRDAVKSKEAEVASAEERCVHLVRLGEQRHQEIKTLEAQLVGVQDRAKDMLLSQGAEISRANIHVSELLAQMERIVSGDAASIASSIEADVSATTNGKHNGENGKHSAADDIVVPPVPLPRSSSQFLVSVPVTSSTTETSSDFPASESLQNLSRAIAQRQKSENGPESVESNGSSSLPSLVDRINEVQSLVERFSKMHQPTT